MENKIIAKAVKKTTSLKKEINQKRKSQVNEVRQQINLSRQKHGERRRKKKKKKQVVNRNKDENEDEDEDENEEQDAKNRIENFLFCNKIKPTERQSINLGGKVYGEVMIIQQPTKINIKSEVCFEHPIKDGTFLGVVIESRKRKRENENNVVKPKKRKLNQVKIDNRQKNKEFDALKNGKIEQVLDWLILRRCLNFFFHKNDESRKKWLNDVTPKSMIFNNYVSRIMVLISDKIPQRCALLFYDDSRFEKYLQKNILSKDQQLTEWNQRISRNKPRSMRKEWKNFVILRDLTKKRIVANLQYLHKNFKVLLKNENLYIL